MTALAANNVVRTLRAFGKKSKKWSGQVIFQDFDLTGTFCSVRVWNQFQSLWSFLEASGVCDEKTGWFVFPLDD